jgi:hypothetical protein
LKQRLELGRIVHSKPPAPSLKELAVALEQLNAGESQCQSLRSIKLIVGKHCSLRDRPVQVGAN